MKLNSILLALFMIGSFHLNAQKFDQIALRPPMGWNSWNVFQTNINESMIRDIADKMVSSGMKDAGYTYIVLDDGWMRKTRDSSGNLVADPEKFPSGMKALVDYVHSKGLKFGLYNCAGTETCAGYPGTRGYEYQDARLYASWDVDFLKFDWCYTDGINAKEAYGTMSKALKTAGHPILFSICEWGQSKPWEWAAPYGHMWRTTGDIYNCFDCVKNYGTWYGFGVTRIIDMQAGLRKYAGPGHWNDPDMLEVGNGALSDAESRAHFSIWAMLAAPLIAGNDLRSMTEATRSVLTRKEVISVDQDSLGIEGFLYAQRDSVAIWAKPLTDGNWAICFLNRSLNDRKLAFDWDKEPIIDSLNDRLIDANHLHYRITDLWTAKLLGTTRRILKTTLLSHDVLMLKLEKENSKGK